MISLASGCSVGYLTRAAYEQCRILCLREPIEEILADPKTDPEVAKKLRLVLEARTYAKSVGLQPGGSYTKYADIGRDVLSWILVGSRKDSFTLYTWWFPVVGTVPYKGFFEKEDAEDAAKELEAENYETSVRPTSAFSTLGWFNDPVLSTMLKDDGSELVNTIIHESVHSTVWIGNNVAFNESLANFIGTAGAVAFFNEQIANCEKEKRPEDCQYLQNLLDQSKRAKASQIDISEASTAVYSALSALYAEPISSEEKISKRSAVFDQAIATFRAKYPQARALRQVHNAEIMQLRLYYTKMELFEALFKKHDGNLSLFIASIVAIKGDPRVKAGGDPYDILAEVISKGG